ncbi:MAG: hypothetical protein NTV87_10375 [Ignavibacteriae bacterium]|nr:hypothetical protein [Ignavibacteriota bacterium]
MKKITAILLCSLFIFDSFGFTFIYWQMSLFFKETAKYVNENIDENELELIIILKKELTNPEEFIQYLTHDEIRHEGRLYDIHHKKIIGDTVYLWCKYDYEEDILTQTYESFIKFKDDNPKSRNSTTIINGLSFLSRNAICSNDSYTDKTEARKIDFFIYDEKLDSFDSEVPIPPPKLFPYI